MNDSKEPNEKKHLITAETDGQSKSLDEVNGSIIVPQNAGFWRTLMAFTGPGALVAVGYMDPGNWITSIGWIVTELAIMATDIAEIIGSAIALRLIFNIPLIVDIVITAADVLILLLLMRLGFRKIEAIVAGLVTIIVLVFLYEVFLSNPQIHEILEGYLPTSAIITKKSMLYLALGIVGATVMPHDLYLGSSISQTRRVNRNDPKSIAQSVKFTIIDSNIQLTVAFVVNSLLLILGRLYSMAPAVKLVVS